jgi:nitrite reductase/ring-hydroxylating ferredoxin subunit
MDRIAANAPAHSAGPSYDEILDRDTRKAPAYLRESAPPLEDTDPVRAANYIDPAFHAQEVAKVWSRCWQMACREEEIPNVGDYTVYEIADLSWLIVRTAPGTIKALRNVCLHRGRKLATRAGCTKSFYCQFHGFDWNIDGSFRNNPLRWDFPQWEGKDMSLPEAKVGLWAGFVFINPDPQAEPLEKVMDPMPRHFAAYDLANTYTAVHVRKKFPANWKVVAEAFMESHHALATHPQFMPYIADANSKYDVFSPWVTRQVSAYGIASPFMEGKRQFDEQEILHLMLRGSGRLGSATPMSPDLPPGMTARAYMAQIKRDMMSAEDGYDYSEAADAEMIDAILYNLNPNLSVWAGHALNIVYRWLPIDVDHAWMEIRVLKRIPKGKSAPRPAAVHVLGDDEPCTNAPELGLLGGVVEQDMANLPHVQTGLKAGGPDMPVHFARYTEARIRQLHRTIEKMIAS